MYFIYVTMYVYIQTLKIQIDLYFTCCSVTYHFSLSKVLTFFMTLNIFYNLIFFFKKDLKFFYFYFFN